MRRAKALILNDKKASTDDLDDIEQRWCTDAKILLSWTMCVWQLAPNPNILQCSKSCGTGIQTRRVECTMRRGNHGPEVPVKDEQCSRSKLRKPKTQRLCQRFACDYMWQEGIWSEVFSYPNLTPGTTFIFHFMQLLIDTNRID